LPAARVLQSGIFSCCGVSFAVLLAFRRSLMKAYQSAPCRAFSFASWLQVTILACCGVSGRSAAIRPLAQDTITNPAKTLAVFIDFLHEGAKRDYCRSKNDGYRSISLWFSSQCEAPSRQPFILSSYVKKALSTLWIALPYHCRHQPALTASGSPGTVRAPLSTLTPGRRACGSSLSCPFFRSYWCGSTIEAALFLRRRGTHIYAYVPRSSGEESSRTRIRWRRGQDCPSAPWGARKVRTTGPAAACRSKRRGSPNQREKCPVQCLLIGRGQTVGPPICRSSWPARCGTTPNKEDPSHGVVHISCDQPSVRCKVWLTTQQGWGSVPGATPSRKAETRDLNVNLGLLRSGNGLTMRTASYAARLGRRPRARSQA